jgi:tetratricopeptide (TPR) repeat protein
VSLRLNISAGELFDLVSPVVFIVSALVSIWVLTSARKRFPFWLSLGWALGVVFLPLIIFPLYLIALLVWPARPDVRLRFRFLLPCLYAVVLLGYVGSTFYRDTQSADAHLARATAAKLVDDHEKTIAEYQKALAVEDDAYVHKLLAVALFEAGYVTESIAEFRLAENKGDPDELIPYRLGRALERVEQNGQARLEFQKFLQSKICARIDNRCEYARQRVESN